MPKWRNWQTRTFEGRVRQLVGVRVPPSAPNKSLSVADKALSQIITPSLSQLRHSNISEYRDFSFSFLKLASSKASCRVLYTCHKTTYPRMLSITAKTTRSISYNAYPKKTSEIFARS